MVPVAVSVYVVRPSGCPRGGELSGFAGLAWREVGSLAVGVGGVQDDGFQVTGARVDGALPGGAGTTA